MNRTAFTLMARRTQAPHAERWPSAPASPWWSWPPAAPACRHRPRWISLPTAPPQLTIAPALRLRPPPAACAAQPATALRSEDRRARLVGDLVTIQIVETVTAKRGFIVHSRPQLRSQRRRHGLPFAKATLTDKLSLGASSGNTFSGKGGTESANTFQGSITATVIDVLPNGHLVVAGEKQIGVNQNVDVLRFSGTIDPRAMQPGSVINSTQVANVRVESRGRARKAKPRPWAGWAASSTRSHRSERGLLRSLRALPWPA